MGGADQTKFPLAWPSGGPARANRIATRKFCCGSGIIAAPDTEREIRFTNAALLGPEETQDWSERSRTVRNRKAVRISAMISTGASSVRPLCSSSRFRSPAWQCKNNVENLFSTILGRAQSHLRQEFRAAWVLGRDNPASIAAATANISPPGRFAERSIRHSVCQERYR